MERLTGRFKDGGAFILPSVVSQLSPMKSEIIEKLADYEDAEEQGLLLRLPCPIGTIVFVVKKCEEIYDPSSVYYYAEKFHPYMLESIGKNIFLTREEAEQALADMGV